MGNLPKVNLTFWHKFFRKNLYFVSFCKCLAIKFKILSRKHYKVAELKLSFFSFFNQVLSRNRNKPSLSSDYSILQQADGIKDLSQKSTFKYMLDAHSRGRWGGIWAASKTNT